MRKKIQIQFRKEYDILDIGIASIVVLTFILMVIFRIVDNKSAQPNYEISYKLHVQNGIHLDTYHDINDLIINDQRLKLNYELNKNYAPSFLYNFITIKINITDKSNSTSSIKKIETDKIQINNNNFNLRHNAVCSPVYLFDHTDNRIISPAIINFNEEKTQQIVLVIPLPLHFNDNDLHLIDSLSKSFATKVDLRKCSNGDNSTIFAYKRAGKELIIHKEFYEKIFNSSTIKFNLIFYDQYNKKHKLKNIILNDEDQIIKSRLLGKVMYG